MMVELVAGRLMARYLGQSIYTWAAVIGVVLGGMSTGNLVGGWLADRGRPRALLAVIFLVASGCCLLSPWLNYVAGHSIWLLGLGSRSRVFLHVLMVFLLPSVALGAAGPVTATMALESPGEHTGRHLGCVYACNALGSIVGTFATGFVLISLIGSAATLLLAAGLMGLVGGALGARELSRRCLATVAVPFMLMWTATAAASSGPDPRLWRTPGFRPDVLPSQKLAERESDYALITVVSHPDMAAYRMMYLDRVGHTIVDATNPTNLLADYTWIIDGVVQSFWERAAPLSVLVLGGGGYAIPRAVRVTRPGSRIVVAEIDPRVTEAAVAACGLGSLWGIAVDHRDARQVVQDLAGRTGTGAFDVVIGDTIETYSVPYHLATREFHEEVASLMGPDSIYLLHLVSDRDSGAAYLGAMLNTVASVFPHVQVFSARTNAVAVGSHIVVGAFRDRDWSAAEAAVRERYPGFVGKRLSADEITALRSSSDLVLTDDHAPIESLVAGMVRQDRSDGVALLVSRARAEARKGRLAAAEQTLARATVEAPRAVRPAYELALVLRERGRDQAALEALAHALALAPDFLPGRILKGELLARDGDIPGAKAEWNWVLVSQPSNLDAQRDLAFAEEYDGDDDAAASRWEGVLRLRPDDATAHWALSRILAAKGRTDEALHHRRALLRVDPGGQAVRPNPMPPKAGDRVRGVLGL